MTIPEYYNIDKDIESQNKSELNGTIKCLEELLKKAKSLSEKIADKEPDDDEESQVNLKDIFGSFGI